MKDRILVTGGAGFIGSEFVRQNYRRYQLVVIDKITYAGDRGRLAGLSHLMKFYKSDISDRSQLVEIFRKERPHSVIHFAAETHVDRSILNASPFIRANIVGTQNLIDLSRQHKIKRFIHISTDEVYGTAKKRCFAENSPLKPANPYAATKAAAEFLIKAAVHIYGFPAIVIRPSNNYGPWQYPEKFVPMVILKAMRGQKIPVYGRGRQVREWLHVSDCSEAIRLILEKGGVGEIYNVGSCVEFANIEMAKMILKGLGKSPRLIQFVKDRPGHDFRYSMDCGKVRQLGWRPKTDFADGIQSTIRWYREHQNWMKKKSNILKTYWANVYLN